jgi:tRNA/tmRNA/rRNA uracil-C5-methylase (TrmA/RlmC/RlmD family)
VLSRLLPPARVFPLHSVVATGALVVLVVKSAVPPAADWLTPAVRETLRLAGLGGLWINAHPAAGRRWFSKGGWCLLAGEPRLRDEDGLWYGPGLFQQPVPSLFHEALRLASEHLAPAQGDLLADFYCGRGVTPRHWTARGADVLAVEAEAKAVACAEINAPGARVLLGHGATRLPQFEAWHRAADPAHRRLAWLNPPRTGIEPAVARWLAGTFRPARLALLSCSPGTLRRDLDFLSSTGWSIDSLAPFDFFPQTHHVETLALLTRSGCARA